MADWLEQVVRRVSAHEGSYGSLNLNQDGAGLSFGILQWSQRTGGLGELLVALCASDPIQFAETFRSAWECLIDRTQAGSLEPVAGVVLWEEPWVGRFRTAGRVPAWQAVQDRMARSGVYMRAALEAARTLQVPTQRAVTMAYDTAVQQGPGRATRYAIQAVQAHPAGTDRERLEAFAHLCAAGFSAHHRPTRKPGRGLDWRQVGDRWHLFAGQIDLFQDVQRRRQAILADPALSDDVVELP